MAIQRLQQTRAAAASASVESQTKKRPTEKSTGSAKAASAAASTEISTTGRMLGKLQQLHREDPAKFAEATGALADRARAAAQSSSGTSGAALRNLANQFDQAARSGSMSALRAAARAENGAQSAGRPGYGPFMQGGSAPRERAALSSNENHMRSVFSGAMEAMAGAISGKPIQTSDSVAGALDIEPKGASSSVSETKAT